MAIPPFPPHDLAKLVLGYLAEEHLMTAYDEFLQASPYLDVFRNEYDRIFMTSLKSILAEYRAVKIYVETCKPFLLRKKIFQCSNMLEVVKFLINHIDLNRLHSLELSTDKSSCYKQTSCSKSNGCEVCSSLSLSTCECRARLKSGPLLEPTSHTEASGSETSVETTSLADLPGNSMTKRNSNRDLATESINSQCNIVQPILHKSSCQQLPQGSPLQPISQGSSVEQIPQRSIVQQVYMSVKTPNVQSSECVRPQASSIPNLQNNSNLPFNRQDHSTVKSDEAKQKIEEFNTIYNLICSNNSSTNTPRSNNNYVPVNTASKPICSAGSFQEFSTGVVGNSNKEKPIVNDCSSSEHFNTQTPGSLKEIRKNVNPPTNMKGPVVTQYFLRAGTINTPLFHTNQNISNMPKSNSYVRIKDKSEDPKVTILSDVKVDNTFKGNVSVKMPQVLRSNMSNSMLQMQTIFINGSPAYAYKRQTGANVTYTKDEIMAMPTIIVVPSSGTTQSTPATYSQSNISSCTSTLTSTTKATTQMLGPLVIDVPNSPISKKSFHLPELNTDEVKADVSEGLVKTVDVTAASLPKDSNIAIPNKTSTPNVIPPARKSSSTPRRNSHVRVLDFATPRRILHETINENDPNQQSTESDTNATEMISSGPTDMPVHTTILTDEKYEAAESNNKSKNTSSKENKSKISKKCNWDAELRALVLGKEFCEEPISTPKPKLKKKKKKKKVTEQVAETPEADSTKETHSTSHTTTQSDESIKSFENIVHPVKEVTPKDTVLQNINNNTECEGSANILHTDKSQMKVNTSDDRVDTPEAERLSLQNVIGAKLNISDLLETPYKQALYDIQMETPKFLGPDLPDEPISDIKIMSIPTPRFLNTPKPLQATPSSYASRPTDYSSGSSYYKPDDHDYIPPSDVLQSAEIVMEGTTKPSNIVSASVQPKEKEKSDKPSRPRRKCTKNVSYKSPHILKPKDDDWFEVASASSETSNRSTKDKANKSIDSKARLKSQSKSASKKKIVYKSPLKPKHFMKIKPRRSTPIKESSSKGRKKTSDAAVSGFTIPRKRTTSKDKTTNITPIVAAAPTKSRRKSSTPRKLNCIKPFNSETVVPNSCILPNGQQEVVKETNAYHLQDSDTEQLALRWSDDGSQDAKPKDNEEQPTSSSLLEEDDITKIKEYIETSAPTAVLPENNGEGSLQIDLIKRGFDAETAKSIERDLLDTTPIQDTAIQSTSNEEVSVSKRELCLTVNERIESDSSTANNLPIVQEEDECEEIELSVYHCNEDSKNFVSFQFDESTFVTTDQMSKLKDKFSMELCVDDDLTIRLRANPFITLFDMEPDEVPSVYDHRETEEAVSSISNIDKLYTPLKDTRAQCYEIFDSTLTSIDTPLKSDVTDYETKVTEIVLEVERIKEDGKEKSETKKRKRLQSGSLEESLIKKPKPDTQYLLNSANIQNIDIESVLSKLHGP